MIPAPGLRAQILLFGLGLACVVAGCGQPVREDRSIPFRADGGQVGFQHGNEGIFLADPAGGAARKIFQPDADVVAVSTPLWSPDGKAVLFLTATGNTPSIQAPFLNGSEGDPAGRLFYQGPIAYTCWKFDPGAPEGTKPQKLFTAGLDHPGYVAANLAVRWHPREPKLYFVSQVGSNHVGLYEWDLATSQQKQVFKETAEGMIFDWTPDGASLACVLGFNQQPSVVDGIWIGKPGAVNWWHVAGSENLAQSELPSLLEKLRASRPAFTNDSSRFAFVGSTASPGNPASMQYEVHLANLASQQVNTVARGDKRFHDLHWKPDGTTLGFVQGDDASGTLQLLQEGGPASTASGGRPVRQFVGWNVSGDKLAYIAPERIATHSKEFWSFLLVPDFLARDTVLMRSSGQRADSPDKLLLDGMRVTFPQWSPKDNKLSLWVTFAPPYRSWLWIFLRFGLRPGDPAALIDVDQGRLSWLAVNDFEKTQVGRYFHLKRDYQKAWEWCERGRGAGMPLPQAMTSAGLPVANEQLFYEYLCLSQLGRKAEADARRAQFEAAFAPQQAKDAPAAPAQAAVIPEVAARMDLFGPLMHDCLVAEVYLSLDQVQQAEQFFRAELDKADTDGRRLSAAIMLGQILLIEGKNQAYLDLCAGKLVPLIVGDGGKQASAGQPGTMVELLTSASVAPLIATDFLKQLSPESVQHSLDAWKKLARDRSTASGSKILPFLQAAALERLDKKEELARMRQNGATANAFLPLLNSTQTDWNKGIQEFRGQLEQFLTGF